LIGGFFGVPATLTSESGFHRRRGPVSFAAKKAFSPSEKCRFSKHSNPKKSGGDESIRILASGDLTVDGFDLASAGQIGRTQPVTTAGTAEFARKT